ncbi:hypothetical protein NDI76_04335 [Halogeometricum sp. S1BR25-6]|uniref:Uncharacterized protein n=1 Tax=Halogeometricum salsisoli TaxID=2950536 RepID=A0ABU2GAY0_9EURY|nr:hypothetical protein [Halogeometricum sp. S1BR25-6]MDS0297961.1 hypothetical protein [Halogeometricum sp. S1BR25-6]
MSSSSTREPSTERGTASDASGEGTRAQASPVAALAALFAVCAGVSLYATVLAGAVPVVDERSTAGPTLDRVADAASDGGVVAPARLAEARDRGPAGRRLNVSLAADGREWGVGPAVPGDSSDAADRTNRVDRAGRLVSVRLAPGRVEPGRLSVAVWS